MLAGLERKVGGHDEAIQSLATAIRRLMEAPPARPRSRIGFPTSKEEAGIVGGKPVIYNRTTVHSLDS